MLMHGVCSQQDHVKNYGHVTNYETEKQKSNHNK